MRELAHRRFDRLASQHHGLGQVHAGDDADALAVANEQGVAVDLAHQVAGGFDGIAGVDEGRGMQKQLGDPRAHQRAVAPLLFVAGKLIQLVRNLAVEERGKPRIALDQAEGHALGASVAQRLLTRHECVAAFAVDEGAAVETVLGAEQRQQIAAVALFDGALDDHEQGAGGRILGDDGFAGTKVGDIQCRTQGLDLLRCQAVERRVGGIEGVGH